MVVMGYYCAERNNELAKFHVNWNNLQELIRLKLARIIFRNILIYYCAERNNELVKFYSNWENLQKLM